MAPAQIAAVVNNYIFAFDGVNAPRITNDVFLLLRDGTIYRGLPVPPDQLDVARSRGHEPDKWGRWRRAGTVYEAAWRGGPYRKLPGAKVLPASPNLRLTGRFGGVTATMSSYGYWGVTFDRAGRFIKDRSGGSSVGFAGGDGPQTTIQYDDEGGGALSTGSAGSVAVTSKSHSPLAHRQGTYSLSGYTLTLRYDDGRVARLPFFFANDRRRDILFEGDRLSLDVTR